MGSDEDRPDRQTGTPTTEHHFQTPVVCEQRSKARPPAPEPAPDGEDERERPPDA